MIAIIVLSVYILISAIVWIVTKEYIFDPVLRIYATVFWPIAIIVLITVFINNFLFDALEDDEDNERNEE